MKLLELEAAQRRVIKMVPGLHNLTYEERLRCKDLPSPLYRRLPGDAIETYKYLHHYMVNTELIGHCYLCLIHSLIGPISTRGHCLKLQKETVNSRCGPMFLDSELSTFEIPCRRMLSLLNQLTVSRIDLTVIVNTYATVQTARISTIGEISVQAILELSPNAYISYHHIIFSARHHA